MADCPNCEYHKNRAARWRAEAYKQAGHDVIELPWVELTSAEFAEILCDDRWQFRPELMMLQVQAKLKEKNNG